MGITTHEHTVNFYLHDCLTVKSKGCTLETWDGSISILEHNGRHKVTIPSSHLILPVISSSLCARSSPFLGERETHPSKQKNNMTEPKEFDINLKFSNSRLALNLTASAPTTND